MATSHVNRVRGWKVGFCDSLGYVRSLLWFLTVLSRAVAIPGRYAPGLYAFNGVSVEVGEGLYEHAKLPELPEKEEALLCLLDCRIYVVSPGQVIGYRHSEELDALHHLNLNSVDVDGGMFSSLLSEVYDQFFSFADVERQIVFIAP
eukprot:g13834.t1